MDSESYGVRCCGRIGLDVPVSGNWRVVELRTNLLDGIGDMGGGSRTCAYPAVCVHKQCFPPGHVHSRLPSSTQLIPCSTEFTCQVQ